MGEGGSTLMDDPEFGAHPSTYRPFLEELCEKTKFSKSEIRFLYRGFKQVRFTLSSSNSMHILLHRLTLCFLCNVPMCHPRRRESNSTLINSIDCFSLPILLAFSTNCDPSFRLTFTSFVLWKKKDVLLHQST